MSLRTIWLRWWRSMCRVNIQQSNCNIRGRVWKTTNTSGIWFWKQLGSGDLILNDTSMSGSRTEWWICADRYPCAKQQSIICVCVCERDCRKGKLALVGNIYADIAWDGHNWKEELARYGVANCGVNTMIQGIALLQNAFIPASGLRLYYIAGDKEDASHFDSHNRVSMADFGVYFVEISEWWSGQCDPLNLKNPS